MARSEYAGCWTAIITPFKEDGSLDEQSLRSLIRSQIEGGVTGIVPSGTTGESPTTTADEDRRIFEIAVEEARGKIKVMAGTGSNSTADAVEYTTHAKEVGADACLVVAPYYNKPTPEGLKRHYAAIAAVGLPVIVYNIKGRTGINIDTDTLMEIAKDPTIVGVKEASGDLGQMKEVLSRRREGFAVLSGDDALTYALAREGGDGVISVASNIAPARMVSLVQKCLTGDWSAAEAEHKDLGEMFQKLFIESNPVPVKYCAYKMGLCKLSYRLPMCEPTAATCQALDAMLARYNLA
ncbi:MAG: 4-hydroxy-tetrahydrodipicolinate synthase [Candidatus Kaiserbacteria bacterium]|nr:MAG: 4-hydroxy-tetrahydrodipicolinate synthase [Candidatus Kaiserbacteria bacterium]